MRNPGKMFKRKDGTYAVAYNKQQIESYTKQGKLFIYPYQDKLMRYPIFQNVEGQHSGKIVSIDNLIFVGYVD